MKREDVIDLLKRWEDQFPVEKWHVNGIYVWPVIKMIIFNNWKSQNVKYNNLQKIQVKQRKKYKIVVSAFKLLKLLISRTREAPILFLSANTYRTDFNGFYVNKYFEPIIEYLRCNNDANSVIVEYQPQKTDRKYGTEKRTLFFEQYIPVLNFVSRVFLTKGKLNLEGFDDFENELKLNISDRVFTSTFKKSLINTVNIIKTHSMLFGLLLHKYKPKCVISLCYYNTFGYALNYTANKKGIPSVDMQHGGLGPMHPAYNIFNKIPTEGFNVLPRYFWCWDKSSFRTVRSGVKAEGFHDVILGGNPWLSYFVANHQEHMPPTKKKIILYTLQLNPPEDYIIEAIRKTPDEFQWWLRLHPRTLNTMDKLKQLLADFGVLHKVEVDMAVTYPLPEIMSNSIAHISGFSGSVIEGIQLGVKTIVIDSLGAVNYSDYIKSKEAILCIEKNPDILLNTILKTKSNIVKPSNVYRFKAILTDLLSGNSDN